jgi:GDP-L-fucose synthase
MKEEYLLTGPLEPTNRAYAIAKIAGIEMCWSYNRQYGTQSLAVMPTNLYGPGDNYDLETSHVIPALIRKFHEAKMKRAASRLTSHSSHDDSVVVWGTGNLPDDQYQSLITNHELPPLLNIGCGQDLTIRELVDVVQEVVGYEGQIIWDRTKPDGTPQKLLGVSNLMALGWRPTTDLREGLAKAYQDYLARVVNNGSTARD